MDFIEALLGRLHAAKGDTHAQAAVTAEFLLTARPEADREPLRAALDAAAVLRWFDAELLAKVLEVVTEEGQKRFAELKTLTFVEKYAASEKAHNVQQSTRLGWRKQLAHDTPETFRALSSRALACFADDHTPLGRIECIYHLLCGDPDRGATELERLNRAWFSGARLEDRYALAAALRELEETGLVAGRARAWTLLVIAWARVDPGETRQLADTAAEALQLAGAAEDRPAEAEAQCLMGDVRQTQGDLDGAQAAFGECLSITRRLAEQDPSNAGWQWDLAVAHSRVGDVLQAQGKLEAAQAAYGENLSISRRLAEQDPSNAAWQRNLALAHSRVGGVLEAQGKLKAAQAAFAEYLSISRRLAEQDPSNPQWQHDLAFAYSEMGDLFAQLGPVADAKEHRRRALQIRQMLASREPDSVVLQREVALALSAFESCDDQQGDSARRDEANEADHEIRSIARNLDQLRTSRGEVAAVTTAPPEPAKLFMCYSSEDQRWRKALKSTLQILQDRGVIIFWCDRMVSAGDDWNEEIQKKLDESEIVLSLISRHFLASRYINERELPKALARHNAGKTRLTRCPSQSARGTGPLFTDCRQRRETDYLLRNGQTEMPRTIRLRPSWRTFGAN